MEFGLLGPLVVRRGGADVPVAKGKQRVLLTVLLLNPGHVVPVSVLAESLWGPQPPGVGRGKHTELRQATAAGAWGRGPGTDLYPAARIPDPGGR